MKTITTGLMTLAFAATLGAPALAQQTPTGPRPVAAAAADEGSSSTTARHAAAQAAGYRALHLCTATFSSGLPTNLIDRTGSGQTAKNNETKIDQAAKTVTVKFADDMEPRIAAWRPGLGCTQFPIGATMEMVKQLPRLPDSLPPPNLDAQNWPMGDANATVKLPAAREKAVSNVLDDAFRDQEGTYKGNTWGVVVIKDGKIVVERYAEGFGTHVSHRTNSMCKSLGVSLVGIGVQKGLLDIHAKAPLAAWRRPGDSRGEITLNHLLHMASGLYTESGRNPQGEIYGSGAPASEVSLNNIIDAKPGERYVYAGSDTILATRAVREAFNNDAEWTSFPHRELLWKLGMTRTLIETDWTGDFITSGQCWSTARDFGRFGLLYLNDGVWNGERILPTGWSDYVSTLAPAQPASRARGGAGYGAQFWIYGGMDGLPDLAYSPGGALGQYAMIIPEKNVVIVRRGLDRGDGFKLAKFSADILKALGL
ncbi:MAG: class C beta-lactamase-related serine hydrolase [Alphaproteobacteria bacterium]|nr:MAG: class C beta-lactamase-related serine hydrolase [Alphaproteobacteria bacterium]